MTTTDLNKALRFDGVKISLNGKPLIEIDESVLPGDVLTVMGPSGSGKSSLLAYTAGFLDAIFETSGSVKLGDTILTDLPAEARRVGLLFQDALLYPHMSVGQNIAFAIPRKNAPTLNERRALVEQALVEADLEGMIDRDPATLSGGQKARVALMRVLLSKPNALLLDEPFSKLDASLRSQIREFIFDEAKKHELPVLLVTHDREDAKAASGKIIALGM